jgi:Tfp pilus assembly protein PilX
MNTSLTNNPRKGFILVISLTLMLVMMTMGVGLYYSSKQSAELVGASITKTDSFYSAETCIAEVRIWLKKESASGAPCKNVASGNMCHSISKAKMSKWDISTDSSSLKNRAQAQEYECNVSLLGKVAYEGGEGVGFDVGEGSGYGNAATNTKYLYRIRSEGSLSSSSGLHNFLSGIEVIDSMIF